MRTRLLFSLSVTVALVLACGPNWIIPTPPLDDSGVIVADGGRDEDAGTDAGTHDAGVPGGPDGGTGSDAGMPGQNEDGGTDGGARCKNGYGWGDDNHCHIKRCPFTCDVHARWEVVE
jgi:hypothetical protein